MRVQGRLNVDQPFLPRVEGHDIQLTFVAAFRTLSDEYIAANKIATKLVPFRDQIFEVIACHGF
jgi:hypothetical protein